MDRHINQEPALSPDETPASIDSNVSNNDELRHSSVDLMILQDEFGIPIPRTSRLAYRSQPAPRIAHTDTSFKHLIRDATMALRRDAEKVILRPIWYECCFSRVDFLSWLDVAAPIDVELISNEVKKRFEMLDAASGVELTYDAGLAMPCKYAVMINCAKLIFLRRLTLYQARREGKNAIALHHMLGRIDEEFGAPRGWDPKEILSRLAIEAAEEEREHVVEHREDREAAATLEPESGYLPTDKFTTPILPSTSDVHCIVCCEPISHPAVLTRCNHAYCQTCLETWVRSCLPMSHTCPSCRQELFTKPNYRVKDRTEYENHNRRLARLRDTVSDSHHLLQSYQFFAEELNLEDSIHRAQTRDISTILPE
jgi:hypothetical protein